jgi:hypothetical protein
MSTNMIVTEWYLDSVCDLWVVPELAVSVKDWSREEQDV